MGLVIGLGGNSSASTGGGSGSTGGGGSTGGLIQDMAGVTWYGSAQITDTTITEFPGADFRDCTGVYNLFYNCRSLVSVCELKNTGKVMTTSNMFYNCEALQSVPAFDTSAVTNMESMFNYCLNLQSVPAFDTAAVTNMSRMFYNCSALQSVPAFDTSAVTDMYYMFNYCRYLQTIGGINMVKVTYDSRASNMFDYCFSLVTANISNLGVSLDLSYCKVLSVDSVLFLFNNAQSGVSGKTIQLNSLVFDQLTEDQIAIATEKGFSVTSVVRS